MSAETKSLLTPYVEACEKELDEWTRLFDEVIAVMPPLEANKATGQAREITVANGEDFIPVPIKVAFEHSAFTTGKVQKLDVLAVTPKGAEVWLGQFVRTYAIGHTIGGEGNGPFFDVLIGKKETSKRLSTPEAILQDHDARKLLLILEEYSMLESDQDTV